MKVKMLGLAGCFSLACATHSVVADTAPKNQELNFNNAKPVLKDERCKQTPTPLECWCSAPKLPATEARQGIDITGPLSDLSEQFRKAHVTSRSNMCAQLKSTGVIVRYTHGTVEVDMKGKSLIPPTSIYTPYVHILKAITHSAFLASLLYKEPIGPSRDEHIALARSSVAAALKIFHDNQETVFRLVPTAERARQIDILTQTYGFLVKLQQNEQTPDLFNIYLKSMQPLIMADLRDASRASLTKLHEIMQKARDAAEKEQPHSWDSLMVIASVGHQARARELGLQYFERLLGERIGEGARNENRLIILENVLKPADQRGFLSAHNVDREHAGYLFEDLSRLQWDVLADSAGLLDVFLPRK